MLAGILPGFVGSEPRILLLDEPAAGLDEVSRKNLVEDLGTLQERGNAILIASHHTDFIASATHVFEENQLIVNELKTQLQPSKTKSKTRTFEATSYSERALR